MGRKTTALRVKSGIQALIMIACMAFPTWAMEYHVNGLTGSDGHDGSLSCPFASIQKAADVVQAGDTVHVAAGVYAEHVRIQNKFGTAQAPIVFEGAFRGDLGDGYAQDRRSIDNWETVIDPGVSVTAWSRTDETDPSALAGASVYKAASPVSLPRLLTIDGRQVSGLIGQALDPDADLFVSEHPDYGPMNGYDWLAVDAENEIVLLYEGAVVRFWDGIGALWGYNPLNTIYLRLHDGSDPAGMEVKVSQGSAAVTIDNSAHVIMRGFRIRGAEQGVTIQGHLSIANTVEKNCITNGDYAVYVTDRAASSHVCDNEITHDYYGLYAGSPTSRIWSFGSWSGQCENVTPGHPNYGYAIKQHLYVHAGAKALPVKYSGFGINLTSDGGGNTISGNHVFNVIRGIFSNVREDLQADPPVTWYTTQGRFERGRFGAMKKICGNTLERASGVGITPAGGEVDLEIYDNVVSDCNIGLRLQDPSVGPIYVYHNRFWSPPGTNGHIYRFYNDPGCLFQDELCSATGQPPCCETVADCLFHPFVFFYHNSFSGGRYTLYLNGHAGELGADNHHFVNNILNTRKPIKSNGLSGHDNAAFSHCLLHDYPPLDWNGGGNEVTRAIWSADPLAAPDFDGVDPRVIQFPVIDLSTQDYNGYSLPWNSEVAYIHRVGAFPSSGYTVMAKPVQSTNIPTEALLAGWPLDDGPGDTVYNRLARESVKNYYPGIIHSGAEWRFEWVSEKPGSARRSYYLDIKDGHGNAGAFMDAEALASLSDEVTFSFRTKAGENLESYDCLLEVAQDTGEPGSYHAKTSAIRVQHLFDVDPVTSETVSRLLIYAGSDPTGAGGYDYIDYFMPPGEFQSQWIHWTVTKKNTNNDNTIGGIALYRNGDLVKTNAYADNHRLDEAELLGLSVGNAYYFSGREFSGAIKDVRFYNYAMSPAQVEALYGESD